LKNSTKKKPLTIYFKFDNLYQLINKLGAFIIYKIKTGISSWRGIRIPMGSSGEVPIGATRLISSDHVVASSYE